MESLNQSARPLLMRLLELRQGLVSDETFFADIGAASVTLMVDTRTDASTTPDASPPLLLESEQGNPVVAVFSSLRSACDGAIHFPTYAQPVRTRLSCVLKGLPRGHGMVVNPGQPDSFELDASDLHALHRRH
jgi:hypothetical protein